MIRFENDYAEGAHPAILAALVATNDEQTPGYGLDPHCDAARELIRNACGRPDADVQFLVGGTQANATMIAAVLRPHQGPAAVASGHIANHETGAVEATGHKVLTIPSTDGKMTPEGLRALLDEHYDDPSREHSVQPGMAYISQPTENGTLYTKAELEALSAKCRKYGIPLMADGARLGYGLTAEGCDVTLADMARLADIFYIGGTKVGALFGEAAVITNDALKKDFRYHIKQRGGMLAKGRLLGIQFETLFGNGENGEALYWRIARHAVTQAQRIRAAFAAKGVPFRYATRTNQQFPILSGEQRAAFGEKYAFSLWEKLEGGRSVVRVCTSWATRPENVDALVADIDKFC